MTVRARIAGFATYARLLTVLLFLAIGLAASLTPMQTDTWWQLRSGRDIVAAGHVILRDTYSHTAYGAFWPNHEWLSEVVYYLAYRVGGLPAVTLFAAALVTAAWAITWSLTPGPVIVKVIMTAFVLLPASEHWEPRPHVFSLLFLMVLVHALVNRSYGWLPLLFLVWANCHGGVVTGLMLLVVAVGVAITLGTMTARRGALLLVACMAAMTLTPLGLQFWTEIPRSLARIHAYPLDEWRRASPMDLPLLPFWITAAALLCGVATVGPSLLKSARREFRAVNLCVFSLALLPMAISAVRNIGPFLMIAIPACGALLTSGIRLPRRQTNERPVVNMAIIALASALVGTTIAVAYQRQIARLRWVPLPPASIQALNQCPGNLYNRYDEGGYLIWFAPQRKVFLDGRQDPYPTALVKDQLRIEETGRYDETFARFAISCAYLPRVSPVADRLRDAGWTSVYADRSWIVLAKPATAFAAATMTVATSR